MVKKSNPNFFDLLEVSVAKKDLIFGLLSKFCFDLVGRFFIWDPVTKKIHGKVFIVRHRAGFPGNLLHFPANGPF